MTADLARNRLSLSGNRLNITTRIAMNRNAVTQRKDTLGACH